MNIYCVLCTRSTDKMTKTTKKLLEFLASCDIETTIMANAKSIFTAYNKAFTHINPEDEDIVIFCHDDIEIRDTPEDFKKALRNTLKDPQVGFVGPAGTTYLSKNAVWWDQDIWKMGLHRGLVKHLNAEGKEYDTYYGEPDAVVVLDGLFLAARGRTIRNVGLTKPEYFEGEWDFYDIHYTTSAHLKGYTNRAIKLNIVHNSSGELVGRDSWHKNREAYINNTDLPLTLNK